MLITESVLYNVRSRSCGYPLTDILFVNILLLSRGTMRMMSVSATYAKQFQIRGLSGEAVWSPNAVKMIVKHA